MDAAAGKIYWTTDFSPGVGERLSRANFDGTNIETLVGGRRFAHLALDIAGGKMYWSTVDTADRRIERSNLDGTEVETLLTQADLPGSETFFPSSIALDFVNQKLYWINDKFRDDRFFRSNFDGSELEEAFNPHTSDLVDLVVVPEPSSLVLGFLTLMALVKCGYARRRVR